MSIVQHTDVRIWKNITRTQRSNNAQSVPSLRRCVVLSSIPANRAPKDAAARNARAHRLPKDRS